MLLMCTFGFGPEMIDFRTVVAAAILLSLALVLSLAVEIWATGRRASNAESLSQPHGRRPAARRQ
jgi:hypothetical protein